MVRPPNYRKAEDVDPARSCGTCRYITSNRCREYCTRHMVLVSLGSVCDDWAAIRSARKAEDQRNFTSSAFIGSFSNRAKHSEQSLVWDPMDFRSSSPVS